MMKRLSLILVCACLAAGAFAGGLRSEIEATTAKICKAMMKKDMATFAKVCKAGMTSDFKYIEMGKTMTFDEMFQQMKQSFATTEKVTSATSKIVSLKQTATTATCKMRHVMSGTMKSPDKKTHTFSYIGTSVDSYRKEGGKWKMASMKWSEEKMMMDGKPVDMSKMGG